jgi:cyclopropane-fatty-acyl-phospholipid synthase
VLEQHYQKAGLIKLGEERFGQDYARTLATWYARFERAWPEIRQQGFDTRFRHLWQFYLAYCEAGFRVGFTDVHQVTLKAG